MTSGRNREQKIGVGFESTIFAGEQLPPAKVLVVDDVRANLLAASALLEPLEVEVLSAHSGAAALALIANNPHIAIVLLDVMMPGMDGFATLEAIRRMPEGRDLPVMFVSAYDMSTETMQRAYALGAFDYVVKPVSEEVLCGKVQAFVALHNRTQIACRQREALIARDRNVAILAHDLRSPLGTITTCAELLPRVAVDAVKVNEAAKRIGRAAGRIDKLVTDLLEYGRSAALGLPVALASTNLAALCADLGDEFSAAHPDRHIVTTVAEGITIVCDRDRVAQAISNLVRNAVQHGTGEVKVKAQRARDGVEVVVENGGPLIPPELLPVIFDPLARRRSGFGSLGLGLAIVREVARSHDGAVSVTSQDARTTFRLWLPSTPPSEADRARSEPPPMAQQKHRCMVLVVDDDPRIRDGVSEALRDDGLDVTCASNGAEAWELLTSGRPLPAAIVLDIMMPIMDGVAFRRRQLADARVAHIPVLVMTAFDRIPAAADLRANVLRKPFSMEHLTSALAAIGAEAPRVHTH